MPEVKNFNDLGFSQASVNNGDIHSFSVGLENIRTGYYNDLEVLFDLPDNERSFISNKIEIIKKRKNGHEQKASDYEKLRNEKREEKYRYRKERDENITSSMNVKNKYLYTIFTLILSIIVIIFYSMFALHNNVAFSSLSDVQRKLMDTALLPWDLYLELIGKNIANLLYGIVVVISAFLFEAELTKNKYGKISLKVFLAMLILGVDLWLAWNGHDITNLNREVKIGLFQDSKFWNIIAYGTVSAVLLGFSVYLMNKNSFNKKKDTYLIDKAAVARNEEMHAKDTSREFLKKVLEDDNLINELYKALNAVYIPRDILLTRLNEFYQGCTSFIFKFFQNDIQQGKKTSVDISKPYKEILDNKIAFVNEFFSNNQ